MSTSQPTQDAVNRLGDSDRSMATGKSNGAPSYWSWLLFKEAKQLAPIMIALVACSFVLHLLAYANDQISVHVISLLMVPFLFAIGASPMLVSQEKEQGTLNWLGSLPVSPRSIMMSKLIVCLLGLALSWIVSFGLTWLFNPSLLSSTDIDLADAGCISVTFALLSLGFALTWMFATAIASLIALMFSACVLFPLGAVTLNLIFKSEMYDRPLEILGLWLTSLVIALLAVAYAPRWFVTGVKTESIFSWKRWGVRSRQQLPGTNQSIFWTQSPSSSLIWQSSRQNTLLWCGLLLIVVIPGAFLLQINNSSEADLLLPLLMPVGLAFSWLGTLVFGSDAYRGRIHFLAQRGLAPGLIWWTRMAFPLGIVLVLMLAVPFGIRGFYSRQHHFSPWSLAVGMAMIFAFTQWFSQWTRSTLISFCVAPAVAALTSGYLIFVTESFQAPLWIFIPPIVVALLATRLMLCPWMDGRLDMRYWAGHGALLLVALGIPLMPFLYTWLTYPDMPAAMKLALVTEAEQYQQSPRPDVVDLESNKLFSPTDDATAEPKDIVTAISDRLDALEKELAATPGPIVIIGNRLAIETADLLSLRMDSMIDAEGFTEAEQKYRQRYRQAIGIVDDIIRHLRLCESLQEQAYADYIERWLVNELSKPGRKEIFSEQQYARIVSRLADQQKRHQSRRRAIVMAWHEAQILRNHQFEACLLYTSPSPRD